MAKVNTVNGNDERIAEFLKKLADLLRHSRSLLGLQLLALWPVWRWYLARLDDGADEPLGLVALLLAGGLLHGRLRQQRAVRPAAAPLLAAGLLTLAQAAAGGGPPLLRGLLGISALACCIAAVLPQRRDAVSLWALLLLSLPLVASLQFYAGYPLRLLAATTASALLRGAGLAVAADGAGLRWGERLVLVDAPCSGVQMLWVGWVVACTASAIARATAVRLLVNVSLALLLVILGNGLRNALLFLTETGFMALPQWMHSAIGVAVFALVLGPVACLSLRRVKKADALPIIGQPQYSARWIPGCAALLLISAAILGKVSPKPAEYSANGPEPAWPTQYQDRPLIRLPLSAQETHWLRDFPGAVARFTDGEHQWLIRHIQRPTRMLHPAADCYQGSGYSIGPPQIREFDAQRWSCFQARRPGIQREVCERITDQHGQAWTDASAWYWDALWQRSTGPWWAVTLVAE